MSENRYPCPECGAVLRPKNPVAPGKKIRCPKCEAVFAPAADEEEPRKKKKTAVSATPQAAPKPKPKPKPPTGDDDDEEGGNYGFASDPDEEAGGKKKPKVEYGSLRDKFAKSNRGPAMAKLTIPANWMMFFAILCCLANIVWFCVGFWPLVFTKAPSQAEFTAYLIVGIATMIGAVIGFTLNSLVIVGMFKMMTLESLGWAWTGAILGTLFCFFPIGIWVIITLNDPVVKAGFAEKKPEY